MKLKYSKIINENGKKSVSMYIFGIIGYDVIGEEFARELKYLHEQREITDLDIYINSPGGSVISGYSIVASLMHAQKNGVNINMLNVGVSYSMGGIILVTGQNRESYDYGSVMIHDPSFEDKAEEDLSETDKKFIDVIKNSLATMISNNTGIKLEEVLILMKTETVYSASEAKKNKFIDKVVKTGREIDLKNKDNFDKMVAYSNIFKDNNKFINSKIRKMDKIALLLGLNPEASEEAIISAITALKTQKDAEEVSKENKILSAEVKTLKAKVETGETASKKTKADALIAEAKKDGRIPDEEDVIKAWTDNAVGDYEKTEKMLKVMPPQNPESINDKLKNKKKDSKEDKKDKSLSAQYDELLDDASKMDDMLKNDPDKFKKLEDAWEKSNNKNYAVETEK